LTSLTLGEKLKKERTSKGVSLQEISSTTRISMEFLRGFEQDDYSGFPAKVFVTGFLRSYSKYLGIDPDKVIDEYEQIEEDKIKSETITDYSDTKFEKFGIVVLVPIMLVLLIAYVVYINEFPVSHTKTDKLKVAEVKDDAVENENQDNPNEVVRSYASFTNTDKTIPVEKKPKAVDVVQIKKEKKKPAEPERVMQSIVYKYRVELTADSEDVWIFAEIDGKNTRDLFVRAGNKIRFRGNESFKLTVGNPKHLKISVNGKDVKMKVPSSGVLRKWDIPLE